MASAVRDKLIIETFRLSHAAPQFWNEFVAAFAAYAAHQTEEAVKAPPTNALTAHGVAQAYLALRDDFNGIDRLKSQVDDKLRTKQTR